MKKNNALPRWIPASILGAVCALAPCTVYADSRSCASAWIEEPFILPDGSVHDPGNLRICTGPPMSPVAQLQKTYVDGTPIGAFLSRSDEGELHVTDDAPAVFVFMRDGAGRLRLERYAVWDGRKARSFDMTTADPEAVSVVRRNREPIPLPSPERETIVISATRN